MKNFKLLWGLIIILILGIGSLAILLFLNQTKVNNLQKASSPLAHDLSALGAELILKKQNLDKVSSDLDSCTSQLNTAEEKFQTADRELQELTQSSQESIEKLESQLALSRDQIAVKNTSLRELESIANKYNQLICDPYSMDQLKMDYSSLQSSSSRLQGFVANLDDTDHVSNSVRNTLWNNADSKIHGITYVSDEGNTYSRQFLVYVNELGWDEGTFYIDGQCWLDPPW
jgi:uncharacterized protein (DUF3084 family)